MESTRPIMFRIFLSFLLCISSITEAQDSKSQKEVMNVAGFTIAAPVPDRLDEFIRFINNDLAARGVNTLVLRVDYNYEYTSYPSLRNDPALSEGDIKKILAACRKQRIQLVPQLNLFGHQSWASNTGNLLREFPQFDETPHVQMPEKYTWPNEDGLYCKSYCPNHPELHEVVFALIDELTEVFESDAFHAGMDEVFYIADDRCPRCAGKDRSVLFADEVTLIRDHLATEGKELWIWGDRLLDGTTTGLGMWEASTNDTHRAVDMIPKDVVIWDWHYERAEPTVVFFAMKGFRVVSCCWNKPEVAKDQVKLVRTLKSLSNPVISANILGVAQTVWSDAESFVNLLANPVDEPRRMGPVKSYEALFMELNGKKE